MSTDAAAEFLQQYGADPTVIGQIRSVGDSYSEERYAQVVKLGKEHGFEFTIGDVRSLMAAKPDADERVLSEAELEGVVGGALGKVYLWLTDWLNGGGGPDTDGTSAATGVRG